MENNEKLKNLMTLSTSQHLELAILHLKWFVNCARTSGELESEEIEFVLEHRNSLKLLYKDIKAKELKKETK